MENARLQDDRTCRQRWRIHGTVVQRGLNIRGGFFPERRVTVEAKSGRDEDQKPSHRMIDSPSLGGGSVFFFFVLLPLGRPRGLFPGGGGGGASGSRAVPAPSAAVMGPVGVVTLRTE